MTLLCILKGLGFTEVGQAGDDKEVHVRYFRHRLDSEKSIGISAIMFAAGQPDWQIHHVLNNVSNHLRSCAAKKSKDYVEALVRNSAELL